MSGTINPSGGGMFSLPLMQQLAMYNPAAQGNPFSNRVLHQGGGQNFSMPQMGGSGGGAQPPQSLMQQLGGVAGLAGLLQGQKDPNAAQAAATGPDGVANGHGFGASSLPQWFSMIGQYLHPYGATGNGMQPIVGNNGMVGGGV